MMRWLGIVVLVAIAFAAGWWQARSPSAGPAVEVAAAGWQLTALTGTGQLRVLSSEVMVFERVSAPGGRSLAAVVPVRVVLGIELAQVRAVRTADGALEVTLPAVKPLVTSADATRMLTWEARGAQILPGEPLGLPQLLEGRALGQAAGECQRLGLPARARERAVEMLTAWYAACGERSVRFTEMVRLP